MEDEKLILIPYVVHESAMARLERINRRLWILCIIIFLAFVGSNCYWIWYESQWEDVVTTEEITQDIVQDSDDGGNNHLNFVGRDYYGNSESETDN